MCVGAGALTLSMMLPESAYFGDAEGNQAYRWVLGPNLKYF